MILVCFIDHLDGNSSLTFHFFLCHTLPQNQTAAIHGDGGIHS